MRRIVLSLIALLLSASAALAQASAPVEGSPPNTPGAADGAGNAWWLIVLVVAALAIWYFARNRNRP
jgi:FtsH-binding integral membrane protein